MSNTIGRFDYRIYGEGRPAAREVDISAYVRIHLKKWMTNRDNGDVLISGELRSENEIDTYIADLKADLDAVGVRAKAKFRKASKR